jgi:hypothetical protein
LQPLEPGECLVSGDHLKSGTQDKGGQPGIHPRTLSELAGSPNIRGTDILEAIQCRSLDRQLFS